jgi:hypothetical protein
MHPEAAATTTVAGTTIVQVAAPKAAHVALYSLQSAWTRKLGQIERPPSLLRVYLDGSKDLTHCQLIQFSEIMRAIWSLSSDIEELRAEDQIPAMWNDWHLMMATNPQSNYFGIGLIAGMICRPKLGNQLREAQILGTGPESYSWGVSPVTKAQYMSQNSQNLEEQASTRKRLRKEDCSTLLHRDAKPWLLELNVGAGNTKEK